jgi:bacterial/archaeal transporter family-2 protein
MPIFLLFAAAAGGALAVQVAMNSELGRQLRHPAAATLCSFLVGSAGLVIYMLAVRDPAPNVRALAGAPWWALCGGLLGAAYVMSTVVLTPRLGPGVMLGAIVAGQMVVALILEHLGALDVAHHPITLVRVAGVALIVAGVVLIRRV